MVALLGASGCAAAVGHGHSGSPRAPAALGQKLPHPAHEPWLAAAAPTVPGLPARTDAGGSAAAPEMVVPSPGAAVPPRAAAEAPSTVGPVSAEALLSLDEPPRCPPEMALVLGETCVDRWESTIVLLLPGGRMERWSPHLSLGDVEQQTLAVSEPGVLPQGHISGEQAERACRTAGKRLCSAREWIAACRGPRRTVFPYGNVRRAQVCNDDGRQKHPVAEVTDKLGLPPDRMWYEGMDHPLINQLDDTLRKTGERAGCTNAYGVFDMVGNLHEWTEDASGVFRGGFYLDTRVNGDGCAYATTAHSKGYHDYSTGFRCCLDADRVE